MTSHVRHYGLPSREMSAWEPEDQPLTWGQKARRIILLCLAAWAVAYGLYEAGRAVWVALS